MISVRDVPDQEYYGILVVSEARMLEFNRTFLFPLYFPTQMSVPSQYPTGQHTAGVIPMLDNTINQVQGILAQQSSLHFFLDGFFRRATFGTSVVKDGVFYGLRDNNSGALITSARVPLFTSSDKAIEFLLDCSRILHSSFNPDYVEFSKMGAVRRVAKELEIVKWPVEKVIEVSRSEPLVINPYVPAYLN